MRLHCFACIHHVYQAVHISGLGTTNMMTVTTVLWLHTRHCRKYQADAASRTSLRFMTRS